MFINMHEYANSIICISDHQKKVLCLNIQLVPSFNKWNVLLLRYEFFVGTCSFFRSAQRVAMETMYFHKAQKLLQGYVFPNKVESQNN